VVFGYALLTVVFLKSSVAEISNLCDACDFLCIQEHWLLPTELHILNNLHEDFYGLGKSAVELTSDILLGRPYGGTCILYRKSLAHSVKTIDTYDSRVTAIGVNTNHGFLLLICVYMPTDYGCHDSYEQYSDVCAQIAALYEESSAVNVVLCGDFNCHTGSRLHALYSQLCTDLNVIESDVNRLPVTSFTYCNDSGTVTSWIDHFLCSRAIDVLTVDLNILYHCVTSDRKPLLLSLGNIDVSGTVLNSHNANVDVCLGNTVVDWKRCGSCSLC